MARQAAAQRKDETDAQYDKRLRWNEYQRKYRLNHNNQVKLWQAEYQLQYRQDPINKAKRALASKRWYDRHKSKEVVQ